MNLAKQNEMGNLHGAVEFVQVAQQAAIKPIFGVDLTTVGYPLLLYVEFPLPTASGKIILQTEGGECFFRNRNTSRSRKFHLKFSNMEAFATDDNSCNPARRIASISTTSRATPFYWPVGCPCFKCKNDLAS